MLDLPGPCGFKGVPQRKLSVPHSTALSPRTECWCALALVAKAAKGQWDTPFHSGVAWECWHCGGPWLRRKGPHSTRPCCSCNHTPGLRPQQTNKHRQSLFSLAHGDGGRSGIPRAPLEVQPLRKQRRVGDRTDPRAPGSPRHMSLSRHMPPQPLTQVWDWLGPPCQRGTASCPHGANVRLIQW